MKNAIGRAVSRVGRVARSIYEQALAFVPAWPDEMPGAGTPLEGGEALWRVERGLRRPLAAVGLFSLVMNLLALTIPVYMAQLFDRVLTSFSVETLVLLTLIALALLRLHVALDNIRAKVLTRGALKAEQLLAPALLAAAVEDQVSGRPDPGQAMRDLAALRTFATSPVTLALFDAPLVPVYVLITFLVHPVLGTLTLVGAVGMIGIAVANQAVTARRLERAAMGSNSLLYAAEQQIRNADVVRAMGLMPALRARWRTTQDTVLGKQLEANDKGAGYQTATRYLRVAMQVIVLGSGAALVLGGNLTPGMMFAASIILARGLQPVELAVGSWRALVVARGNYNRIKDALARAPGPADQMALPTPLGRLDVESVTYVAGGEKRPVLRGVSFGLEAGEALGIIGPAASGKSTLARVVLGVWRPASGKVRLDGADILSWPRERLGAHIGYLPQEVELFPGTVAENIARMGEPEAEVVLAAARLTGVHEMVLRLPEGYDTRIMAGGLILSPGQRQRIALARAFYGTPKLIVLDEPNANLDFEGEEALINAVKEARDRGITVLIIAHRLGVLRHVSKVLLLKDGIVQALGNRDEVMARLTQGQGRAAVGAVVHMPTLPRPGGGT
ncbi:MAG: type I secretion system permease/ATPase [Alphaproteobacteria bacterium]